jgi:hypothetical protein
MDATAWLRISIIAYSLAGVLVAVSIIMFFKMNIWAIIGDLTGRTAARQIQEIREQNKTSGNKRLLPKAFNLESESKKLSNRSGILKVFGKTGSTNEVAYRPQTIETLPTEVIKEQEYDSETTALLYEETELLSNESDLSTTILSDETDILGSHSDEVTTLNETTVLSSTDDLNDLHTEIAAVGFKKVKDITVTHTSEVI